ncbi:ELMO domain-containing protein 2-like [Scleropages formosus]|uniref:ELMO domain-containing protein 2-like n=2 Tax=Scleropages formosus TaxID=113540 RepID=A0A0P7UR78_SCLFO|nr:ELMO domain-containing protein 2-like [Scleropages formosus]
MQGMLGYIWQYFYTSFFRFWLKWILRQVTGKCELQRICSGYKQGAPRTSRAEYSLESSKSKALRSAVSVDEDQVEKCVVAIMQEKNIHSQKDPTFKANLRVCIFQITGYKKLYNSVENLRKEVFDSENKAHEDMLLKLWNLLKPSVKLESRITKQWGDVGFQGDDPKTDFRGMGMLGLTNLVFFSERYTDLSQQVLSHSNHPKLGYSYAIVGINLTEMAYSLLKAGTLKPHFYNGVLGVPHLEHFHQLYCYLAYEFDKFWMEEEPTSIMEFNQYREKFQEKVKKLLEQPDVSLSLRELSDQ